MGPLDNPRKVIGTDVAMIGVVDPDKDEVSLTLFDAAKTLKLAKLVSQDELTPQDEDAYQQAFECVVGLLVMRYSSDCGAYEVKAAAAVSGYGPALYDVAMTFAQIVGTDGVIPDRSSVSPAAERVWQRSLDQRRDIVAAPVPPGACPTYDERPALDHVFARRTPLRQYNGLVHRGERLGQELVSTLGSEEAAYGFLSYLRQVFWNCKYHKACPGAFPSPERSVWHRVYDTLVDALS